MGDSQAVIFQPAPNKTRNLCTGLAVWCLALGLQGRAQSVKATRMGDLVGVYLKSIPRRRTPEVSGW